MKFSTTLIDLSAECAGILVGACVFFVAGLLSDPHFLSPGATLAALAIVGSVSGSLVAGGASLYGEASSLAARRGARSACWAVLTGGVCLVLESARNRGANPSARLLLHVAAAAVPAMAAGAIPATIAALFFRGSGSDRVFPSLEASPLTGAIRWILRIGLAWGIIAASLAPFRTRPLPSVTQPSIAIRPAPVAQPPLPPPFQYTMPETLKEAPTTAWKVREFRNLGLMEQNRALAFSHDHRFLAGMTDARTLTILELNTEGVRRISPLPAPVTRLAFDPEGKRLFAVMEGQPKALAVIFSDTGRVVPLPQPKKHAVPEGALVWDEENKVTFVDKAGVGAALDLLTLELSPLALTQDDYARFEKSPQVILPRNDKGQFLVSEEALTAQLPDTEGGERWAWTGRRLLALSDGRYPVRRFFPEIEVGDGDRLAGVPDGSVILRFRNDNLVAYYFEARTAPPLRWKVTLPQPPEKMARKEEVAKALAGGDLRMNLYSRLINPLTQKTIGPDRERVKARVRVLRWEGTEAEVWIEALGDPVTPADVFADPHLLGPEFQRLDFDQPHRWWTVAGDPLPDAGDVVKLDTLDELKKRSDEALAQLKASTVSDENRTARPRVSESVTDPSQTPLDRRTVDDIWKDEFAGSPPRSQAILDEVRSFVTKHHRRISEGKVAEMVAADYAAKVDHFKNGVVDRDAILKDELAYHRQYKFVRETIRNGDIRVRPVADGWCEARYIMDNDWEMLDGRTGKGGFFITLGLQRQPAGWRIISQQAEKLK